MTWANGSGDSDEPKKRELLPTGDKAGELVEVLAAMYRAMRHAEDAATDDDKSKQNQQRDTCPKKQEEEREVDR